MAQKYFAVTGLSKFRCANFHLRGQLQTEAEADLATSSMDEEGKCGIGRPSEGNPVMKLDGVTKDVQGQGGVKQASWLLIPCSRYNGYTASDTWTCYHRTRHCYLYLWSNGVGDFWKVHKGEWQRSLKGTDWLTLGHVYCSGTAGAPLSNHSLFPNQYWEHAETKHGWLGTQWCSPISKG